MKRARETFENLARCESLLELELENGYDIMHDVEMNLHDIIMIVCVTGLASNYNLGCYSMPLQVCCDL